MIRRLLFSPLALLLLTLQVFSLRIMADEATPAASAAENGDPTGISLALTGVVIVFAGLAAISLFIALLPKVVGSFQRKSADHGVLHTKAVPRMEVGQLDDATLAAITMVLRAESERVSGANLKVTLGFSQSSWALSSKMRIIPGRINS